MSRARVAAAVAGAFVAGWFCCIAEALVGSKLHALFDDWRTWQGASPEKRARIRVDDDRFDWAPTDQMGSKQ